MPVVSTFFGIEIRMYYREHGVPHFHAEYRGERASFTFNGKLLAAAPPRKWHGQTVDGVQNAKAHLAIYRISPSSLEKSARARDQFGRRLVHAFRRVLLAVPCDKGKWEEVD